MENPIPILKYSEEWFQEPPNGRYIEHRIDPNYINRLSEKSRKRHLKEYSSLLGIGI